MIVVGPESNVRFVKLLAVLRESNIWVFGVIKRNLQKTLYVESPFVALNAFSPYLFVSRGR